MRTLLLQLYWLSFAVIGLGTLLAVQRSGKLQHSKFWQFLRATHPLLRLLVVWVCGLIALLPVVVLSYIFEWPLRALEVVYLVALCGAVALVFMHRRKLYPWLYWPKFSTATFCLALVLAASLMFDYVLSLKVGGPLYGDAPVQLAKITYFQHVHFALTDPFYSNHGVVDPRYSTNLLGACQALAARLLGTTAVWVWTNSYAFYRLVEWTSLFVLLWVYLGKKYRHLAYIVAALLPVVWGGYFLFGELPDRIVLVWAALLLIGLKLWLETDNWWLLVMAATLIACTHSLFSLITLGYVLLTAAVLWLGRARPLRRLWPLALCAVPLVIPVMVNLHYPNHTNDDKAAYVSGAISGTTPVSRHYGPFTLAQIPYPPVLAIVVCVALVLYVWVAQKLGRRSLWLLAYGAAVVGFAVLAQTKLLAFVGYGLLLRLAGKRSVRLALLALFCYFGIIIYNPAFWGMAGSSVPPWVVARFQELNLFSLVAAMLGALWLAQWPLYRWGYRRSSYAMLAVVAALFVVYWQWPHTNTYNIVTIHDTKNVAFETQRQASLATLAKLAPQLQSQTVFSTDPNLAIRLPGLFPTNVYSFNPENESPMTNIQARETCSVRFAKRLQPAELRAVGVTRVLTNLSYDEHFGYVAEKQSGLMLLAQAGTYRVYAVPHGPAARSVSDCTVPYGQ